MDAAEIEMEQKLYFPTQIFSWTQPEPEQMNSELLSLIYGEREADLKGLERSNIRSLGGWHSHVNLHKSPDYKMLVDLIGTAGEQISRKLGYREGFSLKIGTMWSIINPPGSFNRAHIHPASHWSGVYYVQAPENSGRIEFTDPRTENLINQPKYLTKTQRPVQCWSKVHFTPVAGRMLIFPSWLYHSVDPNLSEESGKDADRVIVSFNLAQRRG